jgi:NADPH:quinone reductase-like Zn-dependent oxidoreductase
MRAVVLSEFGAAPAVSDVPVAEPGEGEVRIRVRTASVNGFDVAVANGYIRGLMEHRFPVVLGKDFAGTIDAVGAGVSGFAPGDRVFGVVTKPYLGDGSFGECVTVPAAIGLAKLPAEISFVEGGVLGLAGTTAVDALRAVDVQAGQTVLIAGATGGVGVQAVQLAALAGAHVIATAHGAEAQEQMRLLGAAEVVDYKQQDTAAAVRAAHPAGVDVVLHLAGDLGALLPLVREGGRLASALIMSPEQMPAGATNVIPVFANPTPEVLEQLAANQAQGKTRVVIERTYPLAEAPAALRDFMGGKLGKLAIAIE